MTTVSGTEFDDLTREIEDFEEDFMRQVRGVMSETATQVTQQTTQAGVSVDSLGIIPTLWATAVVAGGLLAAVTGTFIAGAYAVGNAVEGLLSSRAVRQSSHDETPGVITLTPNLPTELPDRDDLLAIPTSEDFLAAAQNRMVRFSDVMWEIARAQLLEGMQNNESIDQMKQRLMDVVGLSEPRARIVARTEVVSASNSGSIAMVRSLGFTGSKVWEATEDERTRFSHEQADQDKVLIADTFTVGGFPLDFPGDPTGPPEEIISCRCSLTFRLDDTEDNIIAGGKMMDTEWVLIADGDILTAAAIRSHKTATVDEPWDAGVQEKKLQSPLQVSTARAMYAWMDDEAVKEGQLAKGACKFPHHMVSSDGTPGAANLTACSAGIAALNGARGGTDISMEDKQGVYDHLARHLRDGGRKPPPLTASAMTAASYVLTIPDVPPAEWYEEPDVDDMHGALTVTDEGRVYGWLAPANVAHRSFNDRVTVPMGNVDYSLFLGRETITAGGGRVVTGALTMDCGHASMGFSDPVAALDHYDNACSIVASVRIGENDKGVWVAGALMPGITASQVVRMMESQLSGDWRPHREKHGWREFAGALLVPVPGFPMSRSEPSVKMEAGELVSSSVPVEYRQTECACRREVDPPVPRPKPCPSYKRTAMLLAAAIRGGE